MLNNIERLLMNHRKYHVGEPNIGDREKFHRYIDEIFENRWLTNYGQFVRKFEARLCEYLGVKHCICISNGSVALEIAARALGLKGEVIVPSLTFVASAHSLQLQGIKPVFADVHRETYNLDPAAVERMITPNTTGILGVHVYGRPCDIEGLQAIADHHGIKLFFDAAHAFGCSSNGTMIGNFGECEVFSFHATKFFNTFEGGAIATNNDELAEKVRLMQNFGFSGLDNVVSLGTNGKMTEVCAAMGLVNLDGIEDVVAKNRHNYHFYSEAIADLPGLRIIQFADEEKCNWQYVVIEVGEDYHCTRDRLVNKLRDANIFARRYFWPGCHRMEPYRSLQPEAGLHLATTEQILDKIMVLPTGMAIDEQTVQDICGYMK